MSGHTGLVFLDPRGQWVNRAGILRPKRSVGTRSLFGLFGLETCYYFVIRSHPFQSMPMETTKRALGKESSAGLLIKTITIYKPIKGTKTASKLAYHFTKTV